MLDEHSNHKHNRKQQLRKQNVITLPRDRNGGQQFCLLPQQTNDTATDQITGTEIEKAHNATKSTQKSQQPISQTELWKNNRWQKGPQNANPTKHTHVMASEQTLDNQQHQQTSQRLPTAHTQIMTERESKRTTTKANGKTDSQERNNRQTRKQYFNNRLQRQQRTKKKYDVPTVGRQAHRHVRQQYRTARDTVAHCEKENQTLSADGKTDKRQLHSNNNQHCEHHTDYDGHKCKSRQRESKQKTAATTDSIRHGKHNNKYKQRTTKHKQSWSPAFLPSRPSNKAAR